MPEKVPNSVSSKSTLKDESLSRSIRYRTNHDIAKQPPTEAKSRSVEFKFKIPQKEEQSYTTNDEYFRMKNFTKRLQDAKVLCQKPAAIEPINSRFSGAKLRTRETSL